MQLLHFNLFVFVFGRQEWVSEQFFAGASLGRLVIDGLLYEVAQLGVREVFENLLLLPVVKRLTQKVEGMFGGCGQNHFEQCHTDA